MLWIGTIFDILTNAVCVQADVIRQDVAWSLRILRQSPGFALTVVSQRSGSAPPTAAFTLLDHVLLRPLPFADPENLVIVHETNLANGIERTQTFPLNFLDWRSMNKSFESMGEYISILLSVNLSGEGSPMRLDSAVVNSEVFKVLGVQPAYGRVFTPEDDRVTAANVALLSNNVAATLFGDPASAVGRTLNLDHSTSGSRTGDIRCRAARGYRRVSERTASRPADGAWGMCRRRISAGAVGIHGLLSFAASSRTQEVGVRVALGAQRFQIVRMFLGQGIVLGAAGIALALPLAYSAARNMSALLFGVDPADPLIYAAAGLLAMVMAIAGGLRPALRAASIDPAITIRSE